MRKFLLLAVLALSAAWSANAQRCTITLNLTSQHSIDTLSPATKSCEIQGITVSGAGIINLEGLSGIDTINGPLYIYQNPSLLSLDGLSGLKNVVGEIDINNNPLITNLNGLSDLTTVGYNVRVVDNKALTTVSALSKLTLIPGFLSIGRNENLLNLTGLENIVEIQGAVALGAIPLVTNFDPLSALTRIGGFLYIGQNAGLTSVTGLRNLRVVNDYINFELNSVLTTLAGLDSLDYTTPSYIKLIDNPLLSFCSVKGICNFMANRTNYLIEGNAQGCNSDNEINTVCASLPVELVSFTGSNNREGNILKWETAQEVNNSGFELQKSRNGKLFDVLAFIPGNGNSKANHQYEYPDIAPYPTTYYRLKQKDEDGTFAYSKIVAVKDNFSQYRVNSDATNIFPNPVKDNLTIKAKNPHQPFNIRNVQGQIVKSGKYVPSEPVDVSKINNGLHFVTVGSETFEILINN
ncbi:MAG: T9SS type A sorting domain-containing protein [Dyadobacter sp.]|uniref:T9SS type A sorting domain-containing protein n=1 Tax=Dyadobacter sp. TaxID=1914288 RepID=UPI001B237546|nr:T9SS type A sorting domain-containing protein [Dyadobacter sp.]MBO9616398.1 T9SS type A sorting domain-containing protein [Dyadobacter sp.]